MFESGVWDGQMTEEIPPLTLESLGVPTPESNKEHIKRLYARIDSIIVGMAEIEARYNPIVRIEKLDARMTKIEGKQ